jgi:hypothetical protein
MPAAGAITPAPSRGGLPSAGLTPPATASKFAERANVGLSVRRGQGYWVIMGGWSYLEGVAVQQDWPFSQTTWLRQSANNLQALTQVLLACMERSAAPQCLRCVFRHSKDVAASTI